MLLKGTCFMLLKGNVFMLLKEILSKAASVALWTGTGLTIFSVDLQSSLLKIDI